MCKQKVRSAVQVHHAMQKVSAEIFEYCWYLPGFSIYEAAVGALHPVLDSPAQAGAME